jgi:hypothetical protein
MTLSHTLKRIRLNLASSKGCPSGSSRHGYELVAPLDQFGHIDRHLWQRYWDQCRVRRFWQGEDDQIGRLVYKPEGAEHARWLFGYHTESGWMTSHAIVSGRTNLRPANTSRSMTTPASCTPFK